MMEKSMEMDELSKIDNEIEVLNGPASRSTSPLQ
jgi:hypothetical protein